MARAGITYSEVAKAAARLSAEGKNPTVDTVREALGGTGSKSTIAPMLKRWKTEHQEQVLAHDTGLPADLLQSVKGLYEHLQQEANLKVQAVQATMATTQREFAERLKTATETTAVLVKERDALQSLLTQERARSVHLAEANHALQVACTKAEMEASGLAQRLTDRQNEVENMHRQLEQARTQFEHYQEATAAQRADERREAEQRYGRLEQELTETRRTLSAQQQALVQCAARAEQLGRDHTRLQNDLAGVQEAHQRTLAEHRELGQQFHMQSAVCGELRAQLQAATATLNQARADLAVLQNENLQLKARLAELDNMSEALRTENRSLIEEKARLEGQLAR
jgi:chromosome segregation ATPase